MESICTKLLNKSHLLEHDHLDRPRLYEARANMRKHRPVPPVSKHLFTWNPEVPIVAKTGKSVMASTTFARLGKRNDTPVAIDVVAERPIEPWKSSGKANRVRKVLSPSRLPGKNENIAIEDQAQAACNEKETVELFQSKTDVA